jgi:uncharacterized membrane protein
MRKSCHKGSSFPSCRICFFVCRQGVNPVFLLGGSIVNTRKLTQGAIIAALYAALTLLAVATPIGAFMFGPIQVRISEALTILPYFTAAAIPGLAIGCLVSNMVGALLGLGGGILDVVFGTLATLFAAWLSSKMPRRWLVPLPPVIVNAFVVAGVLSYTLHMPYWPWVLSIGLGLFAACYVLGYPLLLVLEKRKGIFKS